MHAPLCMGKVDVNRTVRTLKRCGHLEVFTPDRHYLEYSRDVLRRAWAQEQATG